MKWGGVGSKKAVEWVWEWVKKKPCRMTVIRASYCHEIKVADKCSVIIIMIGDIHLKFL